jgi:1,4-dihydroxy-2-naphthoate octaprenyltransferase
MVERQAPGPGSSEASIESSGSLPEKIGLYVRELRAPFFSASIVPVLLGAAIAFGRDGIFRWDLFLLTLAGGMLLHAGTNVANDYFDHRSGNDAVNIDFVRPFTGGSRMIQKGLLSPGEVLAESLILFALGASIGLYLAWLRGPAVLWLGLIGVVSGFFYTAPPINVASRGLGEATIALNFGPLMCLGSYYVQSMRLGWEPVIAALPVGVLIGTVVYINEFQDSAADGAVGKRTLVVRLGLRRAARVYLLLLLLTYLLLLAGVLAGRVSAYALLGLASVPLAVGAGRTALLHYGDRLRLVPANSATILIHLSVGLLLALGYLLVGLGG